MGNLDDVGIDLVQPVGQGEADDELGEFEIFAFDVGGWFSPESRSLAFDFFLENEKARMYVVRYEYKLYDMNTILSNINVVAHNETYMASELTVTAVVLGTSFAKEVELSAQRRR